MIIDKPEVEILVGLDSLTYAGNMLNLATVKDHPKFVFVRGDICNREVVQKVFEDHNITHVLHLAAESHVDRSIVGPMDFITTNVFGAFNLMEAARKIWGANLSDKRFHIVSTDEVYGSIAEGSWTEESPFSPNSPYAASKASADLLAVSYFKTYGFPVTITHSSNNFGPRQHPEKLIPKTILNALRGYRVPVYGDGLNVRDWIYVCDHVDALWAALTRGKPGERYNIGGDNLLVNIELVKVLLKMAGAKKSLIEFVSDRLGHDRRYAVNSKKAHRELSWSAHRSLTETLSSTVDWYRNNPQWVDAVLAPR